MNKLPRLFRVTVLFLVAAILALVLASCGKRKDVDANAFAALISGFTGGVVSADAPVRVTFVNPVPEASAGKALKKSPFKFSPSLKGGAYWVDDRTLEFRPRERLERGRKYEAVLRLDRILEVPRRCASSGSRSPP